MKNKLASLDSGTFKTQGVEAGKQISAGSAWKKARTILMFMSMQNEIDTHFLLWETLSGGKNLFLPRIIQNDIAFYKIDTLDGPWDTGPFGILEPPMDDQRRFSPDNAEFPLLVIVPGLAFDKKGNRLGRGRGFYDRFLSELKASSSYNAQNTVFLGFCLTEQLLDRVPAEDYDQRVDEICTGNDYIEIN